MSVKSVPPRGEIPVEQTWDLEALFPSDQAWEESFAEVTRRLPELAHLAGTLGQSARALNHALRRRDEAGLILDRVYVYANQRFHEDTTRAQYQAYADRVTTLVSEFGTAMAFFTPEVLAIPPERLESFLVEEPELHLYRHHLDEITRLRPHIRSAEVEQVLAAASEMAHAPGHTFEMLHNADLKLPIIRDDEGNEVQLSNGNYATFIHGANREVRQAAFEGMHQTIKNQQNTLAANLGAQVKKNLFFAKERRYGTSLEAALDGHNIPTLVYTNLVQTVNANLPVLHRYLALRQKVLQLGDRHHMYDLYVPLVSGVDVTIPFDEARERVAAALRPLGEVYTTALTAGMASRWIDVMENQGKRSGAYSWGSYGAHPFVLLNYHGKLNDVMTLAHEMGHAMHSYFTWETQPYPYGDYTIFLAEIASTLNEAMLTHHLLRTVKDPTVRAFVLNQYLESFRTTLFRQAMFADFELTIHRKAEAGQALTPELLCGVYQDLNERYYGAGGIQVDDLISWEWGRIPHFYTSYYVYQYATGIAASTALAHAILHEGQPAVDRYLRLLRSGSSNYSIDLLREAGVDMTTPAPVEAAITEFNRAIGEMEALLPSLAKPA